MHTTYVRTKWSVVVVLGMVLGMLFTPAAEAATYSGGSGILGDPYLISTVQDLLDLANPANSGDWASHFLMTTDIDMMGVTGFTPIAPDTDPATGNFQGTPFSGVFNGSNYAIQNLVIDLPTQDFIGLFGRGSSSSQIKNLGMVGGSVTGKEAVGGLIGNMEGGEVTSCYATAVVNGNYDFVGGLIGRFGNGVVTACYATGIVTGQAGYVGGLVGYCYGTLMSSYATGTVIGASYYVGGLAGSSWDIITACYATGDVTGTSGYVGGLIGRTLDGTVTCCYSTGVVSGASSVGGLVSSCSGSVWGSFWNIEVSGLQGSDGGKGLTTAQMKTVSIFQNAGWSAYNWVMIEGEYPRLSWEGTGAPAIPIPEPPPLSGNGTEVSPYLVETASEFALLSWYTEILDKHILLVNDLDCAGITLYPIGTLGSFTGVFGGGGHLIYNATIDTPGDMRVGLFGTVGSGGEIYNIGLVNCTIIGSQYVGGFVGYNSGGTMTSCYATGAVTGVSRVGGLVGYNTSGTVTSCYAMDSVTGDSEVGGLIGYNSSGTMTACYATGTVTGTSDRGGLIGDSYPNDPVVISSFWDTESTGQQSSEGGNGLTTSEMKTRSTFQNAGWNFYDWVMNEGNYPRLAWEATSGTSFSTLFPGSGTETEPFLVSTVSDIQILKEAETYWSKQFLMTNDIDMLGVTEFTPIGILANPPYIANAPFTGVFDGNSHVIHNLIINLPVQSGVGLFGYVLGESSHIKNLGVRDGTISGNNYVGGLIGRNEEGMVTSCYTTCSVTGTGNYVGGLIGKTEFGVITTCYATGNVTGFEYTGGLVGEHKAVLLDLNTKIQTCFATGIVTGTSYTGGLVGESTGKVVDSYALGTVTGTDSVGGLIGAIGLGGYPTRCYATGAIFASTNLGGLAGTIIGTNSTSFWDITTGGPNNGYGVGIPTEQMKQQVTFESAGWDFTGLPPVWFIYEGYTYPQLNGMLVSIDSIESLQALSYASGGSFFLTRDLDAYATEGWSDKSGMPGFIPIGTAAQPFNGTLIGNGHRIFGLHINRPALDAVGLFGHISPSGVICGIGLDDITITGANQTGGLAGVNAGTIEQCYTRGAITGLQEVGGLVGQNSGMITETYTVTTVQQQIAGGPPPQSHGGLVGMDAGGSVTLSFWDTEVSGIFSSAGGTGATTGVLKTQDTYTTAGWDMTNVWSITNNLTYPYFRNSAQARVVTGPARLINADNVDVVVESFLPSVFITVGGGAYPTWYKFDTASQASITVSLKQEAINKLVISTLSEMGMETVIAKYHVYESNAFPDTPTAVSSLQVTPAVLSLAENDSQQFICVVSFVDGSTADVTPMCNWNVYGNTIISGSTITTAGLYTHGTNPVQLQALLHTEQGWVYSNTSVITTSKSGDDKAGNGLVSGVVRSHYTGLGLSGANITVYNVYSPGVAAQYSMYDSLGNYMFFQPEGVYHFEGATADHRSETFQGGRLLRSPELLNPGPPEVWSPPEYSGQVKSDHPLQYNFDLRPNDSQAPWVFYVEPSESCTVKEPNLVVTAINADKYSELSAATFTLNSNLHDVRDNISTTGFYRNTWSLELGLNTLRLYTVDTEGNASERSIEVIYDPDYDSSGYTPPDPDGPPATDCVAMTLTSPQDGTSLRGDAVTLYAEALGGDPSAVAAVSFEARGAGTGDAWVILGATLEAPHAFVWDTTLYPEGTYQLRAVAISHDGCVDSTAAVIDVTVANDAPYFQRVEMGTHYLTAPVSATSDTTLTLWDGTRFARITVPEGALALDDTLTAFFPDAGAFTPALTAWQQDAGLYLDVSLQNHTGDFLGGKHAILEVGYPDSDRNDLVDVSELRVPLLQLRYLPAPTASFVGLPASSLSRGNLCIVGETSHFSAFSIVEIQPAPPLNLLTDTLPNGYVGIAYTELLEADGGEAPYSWSVVSGALPDGLSINGNSLEGTPTVSGDFSFMLQVADAQVPPYTETRSFTVTVFDADQSTVTVAYATGQVGNTNALPITWDITFSEAVTGFDTSDIALEGTASKDAVFTVTGSDAAYQVEITTLPYDGTLRPHVIAGGAQSVATSAPCTASSDEKWVWIDRRAPMATITSVYAGLQEYGVSGPIVVEYLPVIFQLSFDEYVTGLDAGGIGFAEAIPGLAYEINGSSRSYTLTITNIDSATTVTPSLLAAAAHDLPGNDIALTPYTGREVQYSPPALPTVTLNQKTSQDDPTNGLPILFDIVFSAPVTGFDTAAVTPVGTASNPVYTVTGSGDTYTLEVTGTDSDGTVAFIVPETVDWLASTSLDNVVVYDTTGPGVTIGAPSPDRSWKGPVSFPVTYNGAGNVNLTTGDITLVGAPTATVSVTGAGTQQRVVTLSGINGTGTLGISIGAGTASDAAGNPAPASGASPVVQLEPPPLVEISRAVGQAEYTDTLPAVFDIVFDKAVINFDVTDILMVGTAPDVVLDLTGTGPSYTLTVTGTSGDGTLRPRIPAGVCEDAVGNPNEASTSVDGVVTLDTIPPEFNTIAASPSPAGEGAVVILTFNASETLTANPMVTVNGNTAVYDSNAGLAYTYTYTVLGSDPAGPATISISGTDLAGNPGLTEDSTALTIDHAKPTANFDATPLSGMPPLAVTFNDLSVEVPGTPLTDWSWDFGDGSPVATGQTPAPHSYTVAGVYTVTLTITDAAMNGDDEVKTDYIVVGGPTASFTAIPQTGPLPLVVQFTDTSDPGADTITSWLWDFGDSDTSNDQNPSHTYTTEGLYTVSLTVTTSVTDDTVVQTDLIEVLPGVPPTSDFSATPTSGAPPLTVDFTDTSDAGSASIDSWEWDFGDTNTSDEALPTHVYANPGTYTVSLTITTSQGSDTETKTDYIEVTVSIPVTSITVLILLVTLLAACGTVLLKLKENPLRRGGTYLKITNK